MQNAQLFLSKLTQKKNSDRPTIKEIFISEEPWNQWFIKIFKT